VNDLIDILNKYSDVKWYLESRYSFDQINKSLGETPVLVSPNYSKNFLIFSFSFENTIAIVLLQNNDENYEQPISFFSNSLRNSELKYNILQKHAYALVKYLKSFYSLYLTLQNNCICSK